MIPVGLHVLAWSRLPAGIRPERGLLDLLRMLEGQGEEPEQGAVWAVEGLDAAVLLDQPEILQKIRAGLMAGRSYFAWKEVALLLPARGKLWDPQDGSGLRLNEASLSPLVGSRLRPLADGHDGWWWAGW